MQKHSDSAHATQYAAYYAPILPGENELLAHIDRYALARYTLGRHEPAFSMPLDFLPMPIPEEFFVAQVWLAERGNTFPASMSEPAWYVSGSTKAP